MNPFVDFDPLSTFRITEVLGLYWPSFLTLGVVTAITGRKVALLIQSAEDDPRINALCPDFEAALMAHQVRYERHLYPGTRHGFHNNSTPRYDEGAAQLAWDKTVAFFRTHLAWSSKKSSTALFLAKLEAG